jgi:hypothetical protein
LILAKKRSFQQPPQRQVPNVIQEKLQHALAFHQQGMLSDAKMVYEDIIKRQANHFDSLRLLGVIDCQPCGKWVVVRLRSGSSVQN